MFWSQVLPVIRYQHLFLGNLWNEFESHGGIGAVIWSVSTGRAAVWIICNSPSKGLAEKESKKCWFFFFLYICVSWKVNSFSLIIKKCHRHRPWGSLTQHLLGSNLVWLILSMNCHSHSPSHGQSLLVWPSPFWKKQCVWARCLCGGNGGGDAGDGCHILLWYGPDPGGPGTGLQLGLEWGGPEVGRWWWQLSLQGAT